MQELAKARKISQYLSSLKTRPISNKYQWSSDQVQWTSMTNFHESITRAAGMNQEPCGSETSQDAPVPVTKDWFGPVTRQNKQSTHQTMKKGRNRCPTQNKVMERMTPLERWNGLAWVCMAWLWKGLARCGGGGVQGPQCSPKHNAFDSSGYLCLGVTQPLPFLPQGQAKDKPWKTPSARAHKQTTAQATIQEALQADVSRNVRHVLEDSSGDGYRRPGTGDRRP